MFTKLLARKIFDCPVRKVKTWNFGRRLMERCSIKPLNFVDREFQAPLLLPLHLHLEYVGCIDRSCWQDSERAQVPGMRSRGHFSDYLESGVIMTDWGPSP